VASLHTASPVDEKHEPAGRSTTPRRPKVENNASSSTRSLDHDLRERDLANDASGVPDVSAARGTSHAKPSARQGVREGKRGYRFVVDTEPGTIPDPLYAGNELHAFAEGVEQEPRLDVPARALQHVVRRVVPGGRWKDLLSGTWLGHPLHPMLTDLPIGFWTSAWVLDIIGPRKHRDATKVLVGLGALSAVPAAVSGASDWSDTTGGVQRVGVVHAVANTSAAVLYAGSWLARRRGRLVQGIALGMAGATAATIGGYLGGHLVSGRGVGVDANRDQAGPVEWTRVLDVAEVHETPVRVEAADATLMVFRHDGCLVALSATCPHRGAPLDEGKLVGDCLECPWHGSRFRIADGALVRGPSAMPLPRFEARERDGAVELRRRVRRDRPA
jgi:nitrite reductase/ring-hydroxylating ferredoxin subunit/uncharacterized membrane protein